MIRFALGLCLIAGMSGVFVTLFRRRFEETLIPALCSVFLVLYACTLLGVLPAALPLAAVLSALSMGFLVLRRVTKHDPDALSRFLTPGLAAFFALSLIAFFLTRNLLAGSWDEFSHWIPAVKELWLVDTQGAAFRSLITMKNYPPLTPLLDYFFMKCMGAFSESTAYAANAVLGLALLAPIFRRVRWRTWYRALPLGGIAGLIPLVFLPNALGSLYVDALTGLLIAGILIAWFLDADKDGFTYIAASAGVCLLSMNKSSGVEVSLVPLAVIFADFLFVQRKNGVFRTWNRKRRVWTLALCFLLMFGAHAVWQFSIRASGVESEVFVKGVIAVNRDTLIQPYQLTAFRLSVTKLIELRADWRVPLSILAAVGLLTLPSLLLLRRTREGTDAASLRWCVGGTAAGFFAYYAIMTLAMVLLFVPRQAVVMLSFERYMDSYLIAMLAVFTVLLLDRCTERERTAWDVAAFCLLLPLVPLKDALDYGEDEVAWRVEARLPFRRAAETMETLGLGALDRICYVGQEIDEGFYAFLHEIMPQPVQHCGPWALGEPADEYDELRVPLSASEWSEKIAESGCTYLYLHHADDYFRTTMAELFASPDEIRDRAWYRIEWSADGLARFVRAAG